MDTKKIDEFIDNKIGNLVDNMIDTLSSRDYYGEVVDGMRREGIEIHEEFNEPSGFLIHKDEVEEMKEMLSGYFSERFYFSKKDTGEE